MFSFFVCSWVFLQESSLDAWEALQFLVVLYSVFCGEHCNLVVVAVNWRRYNILCLIFLWSERVPGRQTCMNF